MNRDTGQRSIVHQNTQPGHNPTVFPHAPGQAEISQNSTPLQPDLSRTVRYTNSANLKAGQKPTISSKQFVRNTSPVAQFEPKFYHIHENLFLYVDLKLTNVISSI